MHNIKVCNFHSHLGSELLDDFFVPEENKAVSTFLTFADKLCDKFKKDGSRGGFLVMDVFVQVLYLYLMAHKGEKLAIEVKAPDIIKDIKDINKAIDIIKEMIKEINNKDLSSCQVACSRFIKKSVKATKTKLFDDAYVARGIYFVLNSDLKNKTIELLDSQSNYMELSLDITDLTEKKNKYVERDISNKRIALLHMTNKHHQALSHDDYNAELELYEFAKKFKTLQDDWLTRSSASPLIGVDWLAPEGYEFEHNRTVRIVGNFLDILNEKAKASGNNALQSCEKVVFRPHVGEGCSVFNGDQSHTPLMRDPKAFMVNAWGAVTTFIDTVDQNNSKEPKELKNIKPSSGLERYVIGEFARYMGGDDFSIGGKKYDELKRRAINNTRVMVVAIATWINKNPGHKLMFRLGHVTHCDSKTADIIKRYDIYVDLNLGSNIRTGALNAAPGFGAIDYARRKLKRNDPNAKVAYNSVGVIEEIHKLWGIDVYKDSGFYQLIKAGCKILIGDDGVGVEATEIDDEYRRVQAVFNSYKNLENNLYNGKDFYEVLYVHQSNWFRELYKDGDDRYNNISRVVAL